VADRPDGEERAAAAEEQKLPLRCVDLVKKFGDNIVLDGVSLDCRTGETNVVIGGSGAGKTTLLRLLIGLEKPTSGRVEVDGDDIAPMSEFQLNRVRQKFGMCFQYAALLDSLSVFDNVAFPLREHTNKSEKEIKELVLGKLEALGLDPRVAKLNPAEVSGGMRKRVGLARALMLDPKIIVDERPRPTDDAHRRRHDRAGARGLRRDERRHLARHGVHLSHRSPRARAHQGEDRRERSAGGHRSQRTRRGARVHRGQRRGQGAAAQRPRLKHSAHPE
jgi:ABC-type Fe3+/spermidine/putrescine transport system ATPase subunit